MAGAASDAIRRFPPCLSRHNHAEIFDGLQIQKKLVEAAQGNERLNADRNIATAA
jgi:hypothetical protein